MAMPVYSLCPLFRLVDLDGLSALYHRPSGATHIVSEPVPQILDIFGTEPLSAASLLARLRAHYDVADDEAALTARLEELVGLGLMVRQ
jgi:PqqD family protein of HPr-rel-A system